MTVTSLTFRPATLDSLETIVRLMCLMQEDDPWSVPFEEVIVRETVRELLASPNAGRIFLICDGERPAGYLVLSFDFSLEYGGKNAWVDEFFVEREYRGQGIGAQALEFATMAARDLGAKVLHLEVNHGNPAIHLYRRHGFEDHERYLMSKWLVEKP